MSERIIFRGSVYIVKLPVRNDESSVQQGIRPAVIISSNIGNRTNESVMVCPVTTKLKNISCNVNVSWSMDDRKSQVLCNQIMTISKKDLLCYKGYISNEEMQKVNEAVMLSLGMI